MGSSSKRLVECIVPLRWSRRGRASDQIGRESEGAAGGDDAGRSEQRNGATPFVLLPPLLFFLFSKKKKESKRKEKASSAVDARCRMRMASALLLITHTSERGLTANLVQLIGRGGGFQGVVYFFFFLQNRHCNIFVCILQILSNYKLPRLKRSVLYITDKLYS